MDKLIQRFFINWQRTSFWTWNFPITNRTFDLNQPIIDNYAYGVVAIKGDYLFATNKNGFQTFDISYVASPQNLGVTVGGDSANQILIHKKLLIVGRDGVNGFLNVYDIDDVNNIKYVAFWNDSKPGSMVIDDVTNYLYIKRSTLVDIDIVDLTPYVNEPAKSITLTSTNGGDTLIGGTLHEITWTSTGDIERVIIEYTTGSEWIMLNSYALNNGSLVWKVPYDSTSTVKVRVTDLYRNIGDTSATDFSIIITNSLTLVSPNGGRHLAVTDTYEIKWASTGDITDVILEYTTDGITWKTIVYTENDGNYRWIIPDDESNRVKVKISNEYGPEYDESDSYFGIEWVLPVNSSIKSGFTFSIAGQGVVFQSKRADVQSLNIYNFFGKLVKNIDVNNNSIEWYIKNLQKGIYLLEISHSSGKDYGKIIIK